MTQSYTSKIAKNSLWATIGFIIAALCNFAMSVAVTRYFGKEVYGEYSYFLWLSGVLAVFAGFGLQQTATKYIPKYFFQDKAGAATAYHPRAEEAGHIFRKLLTVQMIGSTVIAGLCILLVQHFETLIRFQEPQKALMLFIVFLSVIPVSLNNFLGSSFSAVQEFKRLSRTHIATSILNLALIIAFVVTKQDIVNFLWLYLSLGVLSSCVLLIQSRTLFKTGGGKNPLGEKLFSYGLYAYISIICTQIVWERSELFFLGLFSDGGQIALYTLSYALAVLFISVWGPINGVLNATTAEVVMTDKQDKLMLITRHGTKYLAMLMLPLALLASYVIGEIVGFVYGTSFEGVALLFPFLVLAHTVAVIITPAGSIPMLKHEMKKTMAFNITTAVLNIILDIYLITKYQAFGAMLANVISQGFSITLSLINAKKYRLGIFNKYMVRVFLLNGILAGIFLVTNQTGLAVKIAVALIAGTCYIAALARTAFDKQDAEILKKLTETTPKIFRPLLHRLIKNV